MSYEQISGYEADFGLVEKYCFPWYTRIQGNRGRQCSKGWQRLFGSDEHINLHHLVGTIVIGYVTAGTSRSGYDPMECTWIWHMCPQA